MSHVANSQRPLIDALRRPVHAIDVLADPKSKGYCAARSRPSCIRVRQMHHYLELDAHRVGAGNFQHAHTRQWSVIDVRTTNWCTADVWICKSWTYHTRN